jgi:hypothetical protein
VLGAKVSEVERVQALVGGADVPKLSPRTDVVDRSSYAYVLNNPTLIARMAHMASGEVGLTADPKAQRAMTEQALNRWYANNRTQAWVEGGADLFSGRRGRTAGYYAPDTFGKGKPPSAAAVEQYKRTVLEPVILQGTNEARGTTGNASNPRTNPLAAKQFAQGTPGFWMGLKTGEQRDLPPSYAKADAEAMFVEGMKRQLPIRRIPKVQTTIERPQPADWMAGNEQFMNDLQVGIGEPNAGAGGTSGPLQRQSYNDIFGSESLSGTADVNIDVSGLRRAEDRATAHANLFQPMIIQRTPQMAATGVDRSVPSPFNSA